MANKYWVVSLPVQNNNSSSSIWNQLQQNISKHSFDTPLYRVTNYLTNHHHHHSSLYLLFNWIHRSLLLFITVQYSQSPCRNPRFTPLPQRWSHQGYFRFSFLRFHHINQNRVIILFWFHLLTFFCSLTLSWKEFLLRSGARLKNSSEFQA
jgi:hypothetical protein